MPGDEASSEASNEEVVFDDGYKTSSDGEIIIDDQSFAAKETGLVITEKNLPNVTQIASDGSQIKIMYDGFGNKTETRTFENNWLLKTVLLRTDVDGKRQVFVYGQNGDVKSLPPDMLDRALTAAPTELANAAGIVAPIEKMPVITQNVEPSYAPPLQPVSGYQIPMRSNPAPQTVEEEPVEPAAPSTEPVEEPKAAESETAETASDTPVKTAKKD
jgi:hypothetical protein